MADTEKSLCSLIFKHNEIKHFILLISYYWKMIYATGWYIWSDIIISSNQWFPRCLRGWRQSQTARSWGSAATDRRTGSWCWSRGRWWAATPGRAGPPPSRSPRPAHTGPTAGTRPPGSAGTGNTNTTHLHFDSWAINSGYYSKSFPPHWAYKGNSFESY